MAARQSLGSELVSVLEDMVQLAQVPTSQVAYVNGAPRLDGAVDPMQS